VQQPPTALAQAEALASLIQATLTPIVAPLVAELAASRQTVERQADQLVSQAETIGRQSERVAGLETEIGHLSAELRSERQAKSSLTPSGAPEIVQTAPESSNIRWRAWWPWVLGLLAIAAVVGLLGWPR
jgi:hypothetical protein